MRIMQLANSHNDYIALFQKRNKKKRTHAELMEAYLADYYWACHMLTPALERMGHETWICVPEDPLSQTLWCEENNVSPTLLQEDHLAVCVEQVNRYQPDILYISSACMHNDNFLARLSRRPRLVVGWHATHSWPHMRLSNFDLILSSHEECLRLSQYLGARGGAYFYPGTPAELAHKFSSIKHTDLCFSGYWAISHERRNAMLAELARRLPHLGGIDCAFHIGLYNTTSSPACPEEVLRYNRGPVWGLSMYRAFAASRIVLNAYCTINNGPQNLSPNMRQLESMGVGSFLLTESSPNLGAFFTGDVDCATFSDTDEMIDKARYYLAHEDERESIAAHGLATCLHHFNMDVRARAFMDNARRLLEATPVPDETRLRLLHNIANASRDNPDIIHEPDVASIITTTLENIPDRLSNGHDDTAESLLRSVEALPIDTQKNLNFCRALRCIAKGDTVQAELLLARELDAYPENDAARHCFSDLLLHRPSSGAVRQKHL